MKIYALLLLLFCEKIGAMGPEFPSKKEVVDKMHALAHSGFEASYDYVVANTADRILRGPMHFQSLEEYWRLKRMEKEPSADEEFFNGKIVNVADGELIKIYESQLRSIKSIATIKEHAPLIPVLFAHYKDRAPSSPIAQSMLLYAVMADQAENVKELLRNKVDPNCVATEFPLGPTHPNRYRKLSPFGVAVEGDCHTIVEYFFAHGAHPRHDLFIDLIVAHYYNIQSTNKDPKTRKNDSLKKQIIINMFLDKGVDLQGKVRKYSIGIDGFYIPAETAMELVANLCGKGTEESKQIFSHLHDTFLKREKDKKKSNLP